MWQFTILGNLGAKPEIRHNADGEAIVSLRVATNRACRDKAGNRSTVTNWAQITLFGKQAANASQYLDKGARVFIQGQIEGTEWEDKAGVKRYGECYIGETVQYLSAMDKTADASWNKRNATTR